MPINKKYPLNELLTACREYTRKTRRRVSFEWALIRNQNDSPEIAHELGQLLRGMLCHVNLIPLNPTKGYGQVGSTKESVTEFADILTSYGVSPTVRGKRGIDVDAGCGQLAQQPSMTVDERKALRQRRLSVSAPPEAAVPETKESTR